MVTANLEPFPRAGGEVVGFLWVSFLAAVGMQSTHLRSGSLVWKGQEAAASPQVPCMSTHPGVSGCPSPAPPLLTHSQSSD